MSTGSGSGDDFQRFRCGEQHGQRRLRDAHVVHGRQTAVVIHRRRRRHVRGPRAQDRGQEEPGVSDDPVLRARPDSVCAAHHGRRDAHPQDQVFVRVGQPHVSQHVR